MKSEIKLSSKSKRMIRRRGWRSNFGAIVTHAKVQRELRRFVGAHVNALLELLGRRIAPYELAANALQNVLYIYEYMSVIPYLHEHHQTKSI